MAVDPGSTDGLAQAEGVVEQRVAGSPLDESIRRIDNRDGQIAITTPATSPARTEASS